MTEEAFRLSPEAEHDIALFARLGFGIELHAAQLEVAHLVIDAILGRNEARYLLLTWANRAGKTTLLCVIHLWMTYYKIGLPKAHTEHEYRLWLAADYRTLHCAPTNELAGRAHGALHDILTGTAEAQIDRQTNERRPAPLAPFFKATKETDEAGTPRMILRCLTGGVTDFRSTEGKASRLEGRPWRIITWDEWPQQENAEDIRPAVLDRLTNRVSDYDGVVVLTGTITDKTEHIAVEWMHRCEDADDADWWGNVASRDLNPSANRKAIERALRNLAPEDYARTVDGRPGGVKNRVFPPRLVEPVFSDRALPRLTLPDPQRKGQYLHMWDLALATAENVGIVLDRPADWRFSVDRPLVGVQMKVIPGSKSLTPSEILYAIEETFSLYGGDIVLDTTDAHGKGIFRELRQAGYQAHAFDFHGRTSKKGVIRKDEATRFARMMLGEGLVVARDAKGEIVLDPDGIPVMEARGPYGVLRLPHAWTKVLDQLSVLREDDDRQKKDAAMSLLMGLHFAYQRRRTTPSSDQPQQRLAVFAGRDRREEGRPWLS